MSGHTPGPWREFDGDHDFSADGGWVDNSLVVSASKVIRGGDGELAIIVADMNRRNRWNDELLDANTRLIAAAPELLALANIFLGGDDRFQVAVGGNPNAVDAMLASARAVYAKATGAAA